MNTDRGITWHYPPARMTYTQLYEEAMQAAKGLMHAGIRRGDVVMSAGVDGPNSFILFMAASIIGAITSMPYFHPPLAANLKETLLELKPKLVLAGHGPVGWETKDCFDDILQAIERVSADNTLDAPILIVDDFEKSYIPNRKLVHTFSHLKAENTFDCDEFHRSISAVTENEPCLYTSSSGTTGKEKWILVGAALFTNAGIRRESSQRLAKSGSTLVCNICTEDMVLIEEAAAGLYCGYEIIVLPSFLTWDPECLSKELIDLLLTYKPQHCFADQSIVTYLVNQPEVLNREDFSSVALLLAGSRVSAGFIDQLLSYWPNATQIYGLSENYDVTYAAPGDMARKPGTSGKVTINTEAKIVDETGCCVPWNSVGELWIKSECNFLEYKDLPEQTQSVKTSDGWVKTGDLCKMDKDGYLYVIGRIKGAERFKVYTNVVYAKAIEDIMSTMAGVRQVVAVGRDTGTPDGDEICYCIELQEGSSLTKDEVYQFAVKKMNQTNEWPVRVFFYDKFPLHGARSKVSKKKLMDEVEEKVAVDTKAGWVDWDM